MQALHDEVIPRHKLVRKQAEESLRETCKTIEDPSLREEVENIIKHFNTGQSLSDQEVAELLLQSGLSPEARKIRQSEKAVQKENGSPLDLAYLAHAITVQSCMTELELREAIERALDRALARYWKLKEEKRKAKEARARMSRLLPPYRDGKPPSFIRWRTLTL
jgi:Ca2+-binding EF-hand superfamily protein